MKREQPGTARGLTGDALEHLRNTQFEDDYLLIDLRSSVAYEAGHIPGARSIPLEDLPRQLTSIKAGARKSVIFYCDDGRHARQAAEWATGELQVSDVAFSIFGLADYRGLLLTGVPQLKAFDGATDTTSQLRRAFELEKATYRLYCSFAALEPASPVTAAIARLVNTEQDHARSIYKLLRILSPTPIREFDELFEQAPSVDLVEGGQSFAAILGRKRELSERDAFGMLELGVELELSAYDLYKNLAQLATAVDARETFLELAQQEKGHVALVLSALHRIRAERPPNPLVQLRRLDRPT
jgi:rubrerythrin/rhodanese-related sulfurtransferase